MKLLETLTVPPLLAPVRLQDFVTGQFTALPSKSGMKKAIKKGLVLIDDRKAHTADFLHGGETLQLFQEEVSIAPIALDVEVLYEDDHIAALYKPSGLLVSGNKKYTLANALPNLLLASPQHDALARPVPVHRLDYPTSGVLLAAKTSQAVRHLGLQFAERRIQKEYKAVAIGSLPDKGRMDRPIDGKEAYTEYEVLQRLPSERFGHLQLVQLRPKTGRKHQLRKHLAEMDCPILGDKEYGIEGLMHYGNGLYLHAHRIRFQHPFTQESLSLEAALPKKFLKLFG